MTALLTAVAAAGNDLRAAARGIGANLNFDPATALARTTPLPLSPPGLWSPNRQCRLVEAADGWLAVSLAREDDRLAVPAWLGGALDADPWQAVIGATRHRQAADLLESAIRLQLPVAIVGEATARPPARARGAARRPARLSVIDLSALWAGPYCAALLAECGLDVVKVESPTRPDPTRDDTRNDRKRRLTIDLADERLHAMIAGADVLVTSARPLALARLGLTPEALFAVNPGLIWVAITAHGWTGIGAARVGFGDDCAAAGGLVTWHGGEPHFIGDALADPLTGIAAATAALHALGDGRAGLIDVSLAATAAAFCNGLGVTGSLFIANARLLDGTSADIVMSAGFIDAVGPGLAAGRDALDARGGTVLPGLVDHHIHLLATAARLASVDLVGAASPDEIAGRIRAAPSPDWVRAVGYDEAVAGLLDRAAIDAWDDRRPVRIQDRTGALWMLNTPALARLGSGPFPACVGCDARGAPTGRIWRGDVWLRARLDDKPPSLAPLSQSLAAFGITSVTDAGAANGRSEAALFDRAVADDELMQRLTLMGSEDLPTGAGYRRGPLKLLYDERDLPDPADVAARIRVARRQGRVVAAHCVTTAELLLYLAALELAGGAQAGDRVEHGSVIPASLIADLARAGLMAVSQPGFVFERGDRYRREVDVADQCDLYRLASLAGAGVAIAAGSDAPYGSIDPWQAMRAACNRRTRAGAHIGVQEALSPRAAVALFGGDRRIAPGLPADLCLLRGSLADSLSAQCDPVRATIIAGRVIQLN